MLKLSAGRANCFLLESVEGGAVRGRYSIIGIEPDLIFRVIDGRAEVNRDPSRGPVFEPLAEPPARCAPHDHRRVPPHPSRRPCRRWRRASSAISATTWSARWRRSAPPNPDPLGFPDAILIRPTIVVVFDAVRDEITVVTPVRPAPSAHRSPGLCRAPSSA